MFKDYFGKELNLGDKVVYPIHEKGGMSLEHGLIHTFAQYTYGNLLVVERAAVRDFDSNEHELDYVRDYNLLKIE
ncbi:MAG: hypothetical protein II961_02300 [Candidatus Riflebacteria bacterium]|nr:hypothetical protein [Candidatus Riflebacteria bacterium]